MNFIYVIHLMCWNYLIALVDLITHSRNRNKRNNRKISARIDLTELMSETTKLDRSFQTCFGNF